MKQEGKTQQQIREETLKFYKMAFCVDGEVKVRTDAKNFSIQGIIELNDSERGTFYIARVTPSN